MSSDDEYEHIGNQVLPVANLPKNFNDDPIDGAEYLFTVRRQALNIPNQLRVEPPIIYSNNDHDGNDNDNNDNDHVNDYETKIIEPNEEWRFNFTTNFKIMRDKINEMQSPSLSLLPTGYMPFPGKKDKSGWLNYINEKKMKPKLSILKSLTLSSKQQLINYLIEYLNESKDINDLITQWILFILCTIPNDVSGDYISNLRLISRSLIHILKFSFNQLQQSYIKNLWFLIISIIGGWNQYDLYSECTNNSWN